MGLEKIHKIQKITSHLIQVISETNGISLNDTLDLLMTSNQIKEDEFIKKTIAEFRTLLSGFHQNEVDIDTLLDHPVGLSFFHFFKGFPIPFHEDHIHLTGSLSADFIYPYLKRLLEGPDGDVYKKRIVEIYGKNALPINSKDDLHDLICLKEDESFNTYLKILFLPKIVLRTRKIHEEAAYHLASELYTKYNVGSIRLKFTLSRANELPGEKIPGLTKLTEEDVILGLYKGFKRFQQDHSFFNFILSPCFRKEENFYDKKKYSSKQQHFENQVEKILGVLNRYPELTGHLCEVDTVGDEREFYKKDDFRKMRAGFRKLQYKGFKIRSHHGETWKILRSGIQAVDNALNIWHVDTLEHGLSLGINPNFYFHKLFQKILRKNEKGLPILKNTVEYLEIMDMEWGNQKIPGKLLNGQKLLKSEKNEFLKVKFYTAREVEHYQHDILNRVINQNVSLVSLPSSNLRLTGSFNDYKDHPFSWLEKKGVNLGVGTDNYVTLNTNYIREILILLFSDSNNLKITKLLMVVSKETNRACISNLLWEMRNKLKLDY